MSKRVVLRNDSLEIREVITSWSYNDHLSADENLLLRAGFVQMNFAGLCSMNYYMDGIRVYPYKIEYTRGGNIKYAGQKLIDGTNPIKYTIVIEDWPE